MQEVTPAHRSPDQDDADETVIDLRDPPPDTQPRWLGGVTVAAVTVLALGLLAAAVRSQPAPTAAVGPALERPAPVTAAEAGTTAHVRLTVTTTSDWAVVRLPGARLLGSRVAQTTGEVEVLPDGVRVLGRGGGAVSVEVEALLELLPTTADPVVEMTRGDAGSTQVALDALDETLETVRIDHTTAASDDATNAERVTLDRVDVFGTEPVPVVRGDDRPLVLAFYYPWFGDSEWAVAYDDPRLSDQPADPRPTDDQASVDAMAAEAAANGVDGFIVSWAGKSRNGKGFDLALRAATANDQVVAGYLETQILREQVGEDPEAQAGRLRTWLDELLQRATSRSAYLRDADGTPVVFAYRTADLAPDVWQTVLDDLEAAGTPIRLIGDAAHPDYADVQGGIHDYSALGTPPDRERAAQVRANQFRADAVVSGAAAGIVVGAVAPGYDDTLLRAPGDEVGRGPQGERYAATWDAALAAQPDWVAITSWNEWFEGTSIEPSVEHGSTALRQTRELARAFSEGR